MAVQLALERAITADRNTKALGHKCRNEREKAAWADCVKLYEDTIERLNRTIDPNTKCTDFDAADWLKTVDQSRDVPDRVCRARRRGLRASPYVEQQCVEIDMQHVGARENLEIGNSLRNIMLVGDGMRDTIITGSRSVGGGSTTFRSATVAVTGSGFIARGITFRNTAGPQNHQAVALRSGSDLSVFYRCGFEGYQDTLSSTPNANSTESATYTAFRLHLWERRRGSPKSHDIRPPPHGRAANCRPHPRRDRPTNQNTGISIHNSRSWRHRISRCCGSVRTHWAGHGRSTEDGVHADVFGFVGAPGGWLEWDGNFALNTLYYGEYRIRVRVPTLVGGSDGGVTGLLQVRRRQEVYGGKFCRRPVVAARHRCAVQCWALS
ncbi:hypothetical protein DH2020_034087 [Rehmannia glutinosa]|uniref:Pectinesterase n=1 Tax=Rehmannia glutinosa TaxID=99300 RepID=A0ABR0VDN8_REHGL